MSKAQSMEMSQALAQDLAQEPGRGPDDLNAVVAGLELDAARLGAVTAFLSSPMLVAQLCEAVRQGIAESQSPFVDRQTAASRWFCSPAEIDRSAGTPEQVQAGEKVLTRRFRGGTPVFEKAEGDAAIRLGRWVPAGRK